MKRAGAVILFSMLSCAAAGAVAADAADYPNRPIRFIVPFVPGGPSDVISRVIGQKLTEVWGQPIIIDNRGSAGGIVGFELAAKAPPDGYTLLLAASAGLTINQHVYIKLPYDPIRDFQPITQVTSGAYLMVINPSVAAKTVPEFITLAKSRPGQINYATTGTNNLLAMELFNHMAGVKTVAVSYKGTGQAVTALLSNEVQVFIISPLVALAQVHAGKLRALGMTGAKRNPAMPEIPAIAETLPGFEQIVWHGVMAPARTPTAIVAKLSAELMRIIRLPEIKERFVSQGLDAVGSTPDQTAALIRQESAMNAKIVKQIGYQPQ